MIAVYSGNFDPPHKGHQWVAEEALALFGNVHLVVGTNPAKTRTFTQGESVRMLQEMFAKRESVRTSVLSGGSIVLHIENMVPDDEEVVVVRGVRDSADARYELGITKAIRQRNADLHHVYLIPPEFEKAISSSEIKKLSRQEEWTKVRRMVHPFVLKELQEKKMALPDRPTIAVAAPPEGGVLNFGKMPAHFGALVNLGFMSYTPVVTKEQVKSILDPCPIDVAVSDEYHLMEIKVGCVRPTGKRYQAQSESLGPIIVDQNEHLVGPDYGPVIVIEGKHRWLAALESGQEYILAWVGSRAVPLVKGRTDGSGSLPAVE